MSTELVDQIRVIDTDTHLVEPRTSGPRGCRRSTATWCPTSSGTPAEGEEAWFIGGQRLAPVAGVGDGRLVGVPARSPRVGRRRSRHVGRTAAPEEDGRVRHPRAGALSERGPVQLGRARRVGRPGLTARVPPRLQRFPDRLGQRGARPPAADDVAAVLGPCRDPRRVERCADERPSGRRLLAGPFGVRPPRRSPTAIGTRCGHRPRRRACRSTSTSRPATSRCSPGRRAPGRRAAHQLCVDGRVLLHGHRPRHRPAHLRRRVPPVP